MRVLFLGSPQPVVPVLEHLVAAGHQIVGVVTQPDRPAGRSRRLTPPPVKRAAEHLGLPVLQPESLRDPSAVAQLQALKPDIGVVAAYGQILRQQILTIPPLGFLNIHPSLLPHYRGPTPVTAAILAGDRETGVSVMLLDRGMDTGPLLAQAVVPLKPDARAGRLTDELFVLGSELLVRVIPLYADGTLQPQAQDNAQATVCRLLTKQDGIIDWSLPAIVIERRIRAFDPWPGCSTLAGDVSLRVLDARVVHDDSPAEPGRILGLSRDGNPIVRSGSDNLEFLTVQPAGRTAMPASAWWSGLRFTPTHVTTTSDNPAPPFIRRVCDF